MRQFQSPQEALDQEFSCYYNGDEIGFVRSESFCATLPQRAWASARRLRHAVGENRLPELIDVLESLKAEPHGPLMCKLMEGSLTWWTDDPQDWAVFQALVDQIIEFLRKEPGPRPT